MLQPKHRATECRLKNRYWGLQHLLVLMSSNQQAQRQAEPDDHVPPPKTSFAQKQKEKQPPVYCSPAHAVQPESGFKQ
ncbi:hypothetical protein T05_1646 [Trichinella murrelli]|uniref:Uncharacterized protein n=1 Tax=Trichinella murrelli TaxID=144512 RepID=A0A0V0UHH7_9BILA|nr:hypothetical protein T05_1646 [Trichinella murrelli]